MNWSLNPYWLSIGDLQNIELKTIKINQKCIINQITKKQKYERKPIFEMIKLESSVLRTFHFVNKKKESVNITYSLLNVRTITRLHRRICWFWFFADQNIIKEQTLCDFFKVRSTWLWVRRYLLDNVMTDNRLALNVYNIKRGYR